LGGGPLVKRNFCSYNFSHC